MVRRLRICTFACFERSFSAPPTHKYSVNIGLIAMLREVYFINFSKTEKNWTAEVTSILISPPPTLHPMHEPSELLKSNK